MQFVTVVLGAAASLMPRSVDWAVAHWGDNNSLSMQDTADWPAGITDGVKPLPCHSHNDYYRSMPLFSAIQAGCIGVESDVWLIRDDLYVAHTPSSLSSARTLNKLYLEPLLKILAKRNPDTHFHPAPSKHSPKGIFAADPSQTLILLVDIKAKAGEVWPYLISQLSPLRDRGYLTHFNGVDVIERPITVVATGRTHFDHVTANSTYRDVFFDAPLASLSLRDPLADVSNPPQNSNNDIQEDIRDFINQRSIETLQPSDDQQDTSPRRSIPYDSTNSYYASVSYKKSIGFPWGFHVSKKQLNKIRKQVRAAHQRGLKVRYWGTPGWPRALRNYIWTVLVREGVDILNVDDLRSATRKDKIWRSRWK